MGASGTRAGLQESLAAIVSLFAFTATLHAARPVDFQRDVRPILSDACFHCHGPDKDTRMAGLRLDRRQDATAARGNGAAIVPGDPAKSLIWQRVDHPNAARRMPPPYSNKTLTEGQKQVLRSWIQQGAEWKDHWAFTEPVRAELPPVKKRGWAKNPIDRFILARLETHGLEPEPEADRRTLIRRVALDLTGLPPAPEEIDQFVGDTQPDAYARMVDRYLASPHFGEHRARYWLDAARYADTHGIHIDNYREMWPYRDWVIGAFNRNLSFDRFTIEQLAGDLLPERTIDQQIATGFHRCNATTNEAGAIEDEFAAIYAKDRADTTAAVWLGLTIGCATCHDHKFDPLTQKDFYAMTAFFRNTTQPVMDGNISDTPPVIAVPTAANRQRWESLDRDRQQLLLRMRDLESRARPSGTAALPQSLAGYQLLHHDRETRFTSKSTVDLNNLPALVADRPFTVSVRFLMPADEESFVVVSQNDPEDRGRGWAIDVSGGRTPGARLTGNDGKSISARAMFLVQTKPGTWNTVAFTYDGSRHQKGLTLYVNGERAMIAGGGDVEPLAGNINTGQMLRIGGDGGKRFLKGGAVSQLHIFSRVLGEEEIRAIWNPEEEGARRALHLLAMSAEYRELVTQRRYIDHERSVIARGSPVTHVMEERRDQSAYAHILNRGMYDQPKEKVDPDVPGVLPRMRPGSARNRLALAQWLVDERNPLTARVTVNRFWQEVFGVGIVKTSEDFGSQGDVPSHPELLDWLAVDFRESGWDVKGFFRTVLTSATYRQSARVTPEKLTTDPDNRLLSRGPRFRMDAEVVRDYALAASGLLEPEIGGPSVKPYQPEGVWEAVAMPSSNTRRYERGSGKDLYRRSMYWFWKRSAPPTSLDIFNAPTRELCTVRRERTNTPLQALVTMNDPQFFEAARHLAERALLEVRGDLYGQFNFMARRLLARPFDDSEFTSLRMAHSQYSKYYSEHPEDALRVVSVGESRMDPRLAAPDVAAMTMLANQLMNLDEVLVK